MRNIIVLTFVTLLTGCAVAQMQQAHKQETLDEQRRLKMQEQAFVTCPTKVACDRAFRLAEEFVVANSDYRISLISTTVIQTYPTQRHAGLVSMTVQRTLQSGTNEKLQLLADCHSYMGECGKLWKVLEEFRPYIESKM